MKLFDAIVKSFGWAKPVLASPQIFTEADNMDLNTSQTITVHAGFRDQGTREDLSPDGQVEFVSSDEAVFTVETLDTNNCRVVSVAPGRAILNATALCLGVECADSKPVVVTPAPYMYLEAGEPEPK